MLSQSRFFVNCAWEFIYDCTPAKFYSSSDFHRRSPPVPKEIRLAVRVVIQRVAEARVSVGQEIVGRIGPGLCIFLGVGKQDNEDNANLLADKIKKLRIFEDEQGKMNRSVVEAGGQLLVVSQFTLFGDCRKGNRPSFTDAAAPAQADRLYQYFCQRLRDGGLEVAMGKFQTHMQVALVNDGPVTFVLEA